MRPDCHGRSYASAHQGVHREPPEKRLPITLPLPAAAAFAASNPTGLEQGEALS